MKHSDFKIGMRFTVSGPLQWQVTDVGTRVVCAIPVTEDWMDGPPYAIPETIFDEDDFVVCQPVPSL